MGRIIYLPFENIPQRYTGMWNAAIKKHLEPEDISVDIDGSEKKIQAGEFLDIFGTIQYKCRQIERVAQLFEEGVIKNGDIFYVPDIFYPGLSSIRYMAELSGIDVKIAAFNHAGRADETDFVQRLGNWADEQEMAWHKMCDLIMVGSEHQARRVRDKFAVPVIVTGAIWDKEWMDNACRNQNSRQKEKGWVIWPHRPCKEKRFDLFLEIAKNNPQLTFFITSGGPSRIDEKILPANVVYKAGLSKQQYFDIFNRCEAYLSTAYQETFGYTLQEAIYFGCKVICPEYACYPEYSAVESRISFKEMTIPGFIQKLLNSSVNLCHSQQFPNNAKTTIQLIRQI